ncbi:hypothetical protein BCEP4_1750014 [Burkholderia cepacia]|nr:hypothetical protein BCEP4_1750014 [Burkholderia cepacia]
MFSFFAARFFGVWINSFPVHFKDHYQKPYAGRKESAAL